MSFFRQLSILIWKNWKLRFKNPCLASVEVGSAVVYAMVLSFYILLYQMTDNTGKGESVSQFKDANRVLHVSLNAPVPRFNKVFITANDSTAEDIKSYLDPLFDPFLRYEFMRNYSFYSEKVFVVPNDITQLKANVSADKTSFGVAIESYPTTESPVFRTNIIFNAESDFKDNIEELYSDSSTGYVFGGKPYERLGELLICLNEALLSSLANGHNVNRTTTTSVSAIEFPRFKPKSEIDWLIKYIPIGFTLAICAGIMPMVVRLVSTLVQEKSSKIREMMRTMGLSDIVFWLSHFFDYFCLKALISVIISICLAISCYQMENWFLLFTVLMAFSVQTIVFCMAFSTLFHTPALASEMFGLVNIILLIAPLIKLDPTFGCNSYQFFEWRLITSLIPSVALNWNLSVLFRWVSVSQTPAIDRFFKENGQLGSLTLAHVIAVQMLSVFLYALVIWYLDNVWMQYGVPKPFYFPCLPSYYCPQTQDRETDKITPDIRNEFIEEGPANSKVTIAVNNVKKNFGANKGVFGVTLDIYSGQITALLGHNGAGKTTTMNMITGLYPPTSGTIHIDGYDIVTSTKTARKSIGLCPQDNVLYDYLSVRDHLRLFAALKDYPSNEVNAEIDKTLQLIQLKDKENSLSNELSGGMKRKLSLAIALVGGSRVLIMDELTTGLDPENRRAIWDILHNIRKERTILITTHYMEEADILGDRIAIMAEGRVKCYGSPMFLKRKFGAGYSLRISKSESFNLKLTDSVLKKHLPESKLKNDSKTEIIFSLESENSVKPSDRNKFPIIFDELDDRKQELGIESYGLNVTTMEDVFIKLGSQADVKENKEIIVVDKYNKFKGHYLFRQRVYAILMKRLQYVFRNNLILFYQVLVPLIFLVAIFLITSISVKISTATTLTLDLLSLYGRTYGFFRFDSDEWRTFGQNIYATNAKKHGTTTSLISQDSEQWLKNKAQELGSTDYALHYSLGGSVTNVEKGVNLEVWNNPLMIHSLPMSINLMYESLIGQYIPELRNNIKLSTTIDAIVNVDWISKMFGHTILLHAICCIFLWPPLLAFWATSYAMFPIEEKASKSKFLQLMTGLSVTTYWFANFIFDILTHELIILLFMITSYLLDTKEIFFFEMESIVSLLLLFLLFGMSCIPMAYLLSLFFKSNNQISLIYTIYLISSVMCAISDGLLVMVSLWTPFRVNEPWYFSLISSIMPTVPMTTGVTKLYGIGAAKRLCRQMKLNYNLSELCSETDPKKITLATLGCCDNLCQNTGIIKVKAEEMGLHQVSEQIVIVDSMCFSSRYALTFEWYGILTETSRFILAAVLLTIILLTVEVWFARIWEMFWNRGGRHSTQIMDESGVSAERLWTEMLVKTDRTKEEALVVFDISKYFKNFRAVYRLSFRVHHNECFGLLGVNGAGKTTTFQVLTGDIWTDSGNAFIGANDLLRKTKRYQQSVGYCPQFSAFIDRLTAEEMLYLFGRLRGIPELYIQKEVQSIIRTTDIESHCRTLTKDLSGGNQRKLSLALAIIGSPQLILLDEPTSGVDPVARRKIWQTLNELKSNKKSSIVLTSHSMDESQALCSRIAIMVSGELKCLGSTQQLKTKYGQGFDVVIKIKRQYTSDKQYSEKVSQYMKKEIPSSVKRDFHESVISYHISDPSVKWSTMFRVMQSAEREFDFEDYSLSDTSLEQIFLSFAKQK